MLTLAMTEPETVKYIMIFGVGGVVAVVAIVASALRAVLVNRARERTKQDIAAYVAEGTLDPDKAIQMLNAGKTNWEEIAKASNSGKKSGCC